MKRYLKCPNCDKYLLEKGYLGHMVKTHKISRDLAVKPTLFFTYDQVLANRRKKKIQRPKTNDKLKKSGYRVNFGELKDYSEINLKNAEDIIKHSKTHYLIWDEMLFDNNKIRFATDRIQEILHSVELKGVFEELNLIKQEYFNRIYGKKLYKLTFYRNKLLLSQSPDWKKIIATIDVAVEYFHFKRSKTNAFGPKLRTELALELYKEDFEKNAYLKYLASLHAPEFKLILIIEMYNNKREESFIFRIRGKNNEIFLVWENIKKSRATHIFLSTIESLELILTTLESFICSSMRIKRSLLYFEDQESLLVRQDLGHVSSVKHSDFNTYKLEVQQLLARS